MSRQPNERDVNRYAFGRRLRELRLRVDLSQDEVADKAEISRGTYNKAENGKANLGFDAICRLAPVLEVEVAGLFDFDRYKVRKLHSIQ